MACHNIDAVDIVVVIIIIGYCEPVTKFIVPNVIPLHTSKTHSQTYLNRKLARTFSAFPMTNIYVKSQTRWKRIATLTKKKEKQLYLYII